MHPFRNDQDALLARIESLETEKARLETRVEELQCENDELRDTEKERAGLYVAASEEQFQRLQNENRELHQRLIAYNEKFPPAVRDAMRALVNMPEVQQEMRMVRRQVRRTATLVFIFLIAWWTLPWLPFL